MATGLADDHNFPPGAPGQGGEPVGAGGPDTAAMAPLQGPAQHIGGIGGISRGQHLDVHRLLHIIRHHAAKVVLIALVSSVAAGVIASLGDTPWSHKQQAVVQRDGFARLSDKLYGLLSEDLLPARIEDSVKQHPEAGKYQEVSLEVNHKGMQAVEIIARGPEEADVRACSELAVKAFKQWFAGELESEIKRLTQQRIQRENALTAQAGELQKIQRDIRWLALIQNEYDAARLRQETLARKRAALGKTAAPAAPKGREANAERNQLKRRRLVVQIVELQMQRAEMEPRYKMSHPRMRAIKGKLDHLDKALKGLPPPVGAVEDTEYLAFLESSARLEVLKQHLERAGKRAGAAERNLVKFRIRGTILNQEVITYGDKISRLEEARSLEPLAAGKAEMIAPPTPAGKLARAVPFGLLLGIVIGVIMAMGAEYFRTTCASPGEVFADLGLPTLAVIPSIPPDREKYISPSSPHSELAEMFSILRNNLRYSGPHDPQKMVLVTSPLPNEGKSLLSANLAISYTFEGLNVLLVDADMRRSKGYPSLASSKGAPGLVAWLEGRLESPEGAVTPTEIPGLSLVAAEERAGNATKLLSSPRMDQLLSWAEENYDVVILDTPAVLPVADTTIFAQRARAVLMIVDAHSTRASAAHVAMSRLLHVRSKMVGAVLNRAGHRAMGYMPYYGHGYGYTYGYKYG